MEEKNNPQEELKYCYGQIANFTKENHELKEQLEIAQRELRNYKDLSQRKQFLLDTIGILIENI